MPDGYSMVERFYTHFLCRDLIYIFSGGQFIITLELALFNKIYLPKEISLELISFLLTSYFLGSVLRDIAGDVFGLKDPRTPEPYKSILVFHHNLTQNYDINVLNRYERMVFNLGIAASIGSSSFFGGLLMFIAAACNWLFLDIPSTIYYILLSFGLVFIGVYLINDHHNWVNYIEEEQSDLIKNIKSKE